MEWTADFKSKSSKRLIRLYDEEGKIQANDEDNANSLNKFFTSVFTKEDNADALILNSSAPLLWNESLAPPMDLEDGIEEGIDIDDVEITEELVEKHLLV